MASCLAARYARSVFGSWARAALPSAICLLVLACGAGSAVAKGPAAASCQPFSGRPCLFPFPDNRLTRGDTTSATGLRVDLPAAAMPVNNKGIRVQPGPYDRNDGFSPGSTIVLHVPGLDNPAALARTGPV